MVVKGGDRKPAVSEKWLCRRSINHFLSFVTLFSPFIFTFNALQSFFFGKGKFVENIFTLNKNLDQLTNYDLQNTRKALLSHIPAIFPNQILRTRIRSAGTNIMGWGAKGIFCSRKTSCGLCHGSVEKWKTSLQNRGIVHAHRLCWLEDFHFKQTRIFEGEFLLQPLPTDFPQLGTTKMWRREETRNGKSAQNNFL